jgi:molybdate transport system ATP-binding protein
MAVEIDSDKIDARAAGRPKAGPRELRVQITKALADFDLIVDFAALPGITILFGPSGAGKTTLLDCIAGLTAPDTGKIVAGERVLFDAHQALNAGSSSRHIGYVFQTLALFPHLSVEANVQYGLGSLSAGERSRRCAEILQSFRIAHLAKRKPGEISGGERQRVALARSLVTEPCVMLLDEPLAALDAASKSKIVEDLRSWNAEHRIPVLYVTHNREEVFSLGDRVVVLDSGKIIAQGTPHEVIRAPRHETVAQLAGFDNIFHAVVIAAHADRGTMTCRLENSSVELETPLVHAEVGSRVRVAISAGDILLATSQPAGLSARNIIPGRMMSLEQRDVMVMASVDCGVEMQAQLTLAARDSLRLRPGSDVWVIVKTHSCHLLAT